MAPKNADHINIRDFDVSNWQGPLMLLKVKNFLDQLGPGQKARIISPENQKTKELVNFLQATGNQLLEISTTQGKQVFVVFSGQDKASQNLTRPEPLQKPPKKEGG